MAKIPCEQAVKNVITTTAIEITNHTPVSGETISGSLGNNGYIYGNINIPDKQGYVPYILQNILSGASSLNIVTNYLYFNDAKTKAYFMFSTKNGLTQSGNSISIIISYMKIQL